MGFSQPTMQQKKSGHILVVDDESYNRDLLQRYLSKQGYAVTVADGGRQAMELIGSTKFDLVLLDIMMPNIDGIQVLTIIRQTFSMTELPVIMVTALHDSEDIAEALNLGANDYITKPVDRIVLLARVQTQIALTEAHKQISTLAEDISRRNKFLLKMLGRYVTDEVTENILQSPTASELGGKLQKVTILFADLRSFTKISDHMPPDRVAAMLNNFFDEMIEVIRKYRGTIDKIIGDGILATFGATKERDSDTERALACAIEMQLAMEKVNARNRIDKLPVIEMGIGINTGEVMVGNIGSDKYTSFSVTGKHVNLAARIESFARGNEILVSKSVLENNIEEIWVENQREIQPKGIDHPVIVYSLTGIGGKYQVRLDSDSPGDTQIAIH